jgi:predicted short-subunit dehydrogenase-like oxidoreductase (DUF2520 family)
MPKPRISIIGPGRLGTSLARSLHAAGYKIAEIVYRPGPSARAARALAKQLHAQTFLYPEQYAQVVFLCVGDTQLGALSQELANWEWKGRVALHTSGAMTSDVLTLLRQKGAAVASVHPMMSFVRGATTPLKGVSFALEGDAKALRVARGIVRDLGGQSFVLKKAAKPLYHAFGAFTSPLLIATLAAGERVAREAGLSKAQAQAAMRPIVAQTLKNYLEKGTAGAFSGPLVRGDVATVSKHLKALQDVPEVRAAYIALVRCALETLPVKSADAIAALLPDSGQ